jgi:hypothetical protein
MIIKNLYLPACKSELISGNWNMFQARDINTFPLIKFTQKGFLQNILDVIDLGNEWLQS